MKRRLEIENEVNLQISKFVVYFIVEQTEEFEICVQ